jgi:hypothetical protein
MADAKADNRRIGAGSARLAAQGRSAILQISTLDKPVFYQPFSEMPGRTSVGKGDNGRPKAKLAKRTPR